MSLASAVFRLHECIIQLGNGLGSRLHIGGWPCLSGPYNLRHTFARRLRLVGVPLEPRKALIHDIDGDITIHYSPSEVGELLETVEKMTRVEGATMLRLTS